MISSVATQVCETLLEDMLGIHVSETSSVVQPKACEMSVHLFPFTNPTARKKVRSRCTIAVQFDGNQEFVENLQAAKEFKNAILLQREKTLRDTFGAVEETCDKGIHRYAVPCMYYGVQLSTILGANFIHAESKVVPKNFLIFINPMAGSQKGVSLFGKCVQPMLDAAEINYTVIHTGKVMQVAS